MPDEKLIERARRAVMIRLREKREKDEEHRRRTGQERPNALRDAGKFARWYLAHLLEHQDEIDQILEGERLREEDKAERERLRSVSAAPKPSNESEAARIYREIRERGLRDRDAKA
jgi:hypothetical protein